jgi:hypothetical protein
MSQQPEPIPARIQITSTPEAEIGQYADFVAVWHQNTSFVLDFLVYSSPPQVGQDDDGNTVMNVPGRLATRVRIPPQQVFEIMKALEAQLSKWEIETGQRPPSTQQ